MLSYRHAFHAGNHADVLKHFVLTQLIQHLCQKDAPFWYIDTHAGAGRYALTSDQASKLMEFRDGIARLWQLPVKNLPAPLHVYLELVRQLNAHADVAADGQLRHYPGSPWIAHALLRPQDKLKLFELHSTDNPLLRELFAQAGAGRRVQIQASDGYLGLKALLPPAPRRALVLIDPSYEDKQEYQRLLDSLRAALRRFATGMYAVWYPQLARPQARQLPAQLKQLPVRSWLHVSLSVRAATEAIGMTGSGMFIINPPWTLAATLQETMPALVSLLAQDAGASFQLEQGEGPE